MIALLRFLRGYYQVEFLSENAPRILNFLLQNDIPVWGIKGEEGKVTFRIATGYYHCIFSFSKTLLEGEEISSKKCGILRVIQLFGRRWGFFSGLFLFFLILYLSTLFIWGVEVTGNDLIPAEKIKKDLKNFGISPGVLISSFDPKDAGMRYQISGNDFVYVNVNIIGTKAYVEVRERQALYREEEEDTPSNLVAEIYGEIDRFEVLSGQIQVKRGENVTEGMLLISGVKENSVGSFRITRAKGKVYAKTTRNFSVTIPAEICTKVYTGEERDKISLEILGVTLPVSLFQGQENKRWEQQESVEDLTVLGKSLPIRVRRVSFLETREKKEPIILDRQRELAYDKYEEFKRETFALGDEILEENMSFSQGEEGLSLAVEVVAIEDICKEVPFKVY